MGPVHCITVQNHAACILKACRDEGGEENRQNSEGTLGFVLRHWFGVNDAV